MFQCDFTGPHQVRACFGVLPDGVRTPRELRQNRHHALMIAELFPQRQRLRVAPIRALELVDHVQVIAELLERVGAN